MQKQMDEIGYELVV